MKIGKFSIVILLAQLVMVNYLFAETLNSDKKISVHVGSYLKHVGNTSDHTENFDNKLIDIEYRVSEYTDFIDKVVVGTTINSSGNRCFLLGVQKNYIDFNSRLSFEGSYLYAGEFFFDSFENCGDGGIYKTIKSKTNLGFAPFIYHGIEYDITENISLDAGLIFPTLVLFSLQINF